MTYSLNNTSHLQIDLKDPQFLSPLKVHHVFSFQHFKAPSLKTDVFSLELIHLSLSCSRLWPGKMWGPGHSKLWLQNPRRRPLHRHCGSLQLQPRLCNAWQQYSDLPEWGPEGVGQAYAFLCRWVGKAGSESCHEPGQRAHAPSGLGLVLGKGQGSHGSIIVFVYRQVASPKET